MDSHTAQQFTQ